MSWKPKQEFKKQTNRGSDVKCEGLRDETEEQGEGVDRMEANDDS